MGMTVYRNPGSHQEKERGATPIEMEVIGFGVAHTQNGNQTPKVLVRTKKGAGAIKDGVYFCTLAIDAHMLSKEPKE